MISLVTMALCGGGGLLLYHYATRIPAEAKGGR
jgi:hypothetical protein